MNTKGVEDGMTHTYWGTSDHHEAVCRICSKGAGNAVHSRAAAVPVAQPAVPVEERTKKCTCKHMHGHEGCVAAVDASCGCVLHDDEVEESKPTPEERTAATSLGKQAAPEPDGIGWCSSCDKIHEVVRPKCPICDDWLIFAADDKPTDEPRNTHKFSPFDNAKLKQEPVADGIATGDAMEIKENPLKTLAKLLEGVAVPVITCPDCHQRLSRGEHVCPVRPDLWQWQSAAPPEDKDTTPEPVADGGGMPPTHCDYENCSLNRGHIGSCNEDEAELRDTIRQLATSQEALRLAREGNERQENIIKSGTFYPAYMSIKRENEALRERVQQAAEKSADSPAFAYSLAMFLTRNGQRGNAPEMQAEIETFLRDSRQSTTLKS